MKISSSQLVHSFEELYEIEKTARDYYEGLLGEDIPKNDRDVITRIMHDEIRHMQVAKEIIQLIKDNDAD
jgi:rubrerythrin